MNSSLSLTRRAEEQRVRGIGVVDQREDELRVQDLAGAEHADRADAGHVAVRIDVRQRETIALAASPARDVTRRDDLGFVRLLRRRLVGEADAVEAIEEIVVAQRSPIRASASCRRCIDR